MWESKMIGSVIKMETLFIDPELRASVKSEIREWSASILKASFSEGPVMIK